MLNSTNNFIFKFSLGFEKNLGKNHLDEFLSGKYSFSSVRFCWLLQFVILNLKNVTVEHVGLEKVLQLLNVLKPNAHFNEEIGLCGVGITLGFFHAGYHFNHITDLVLKSYHISPPIQADTRIILTTLDSRSRSHSTEQLSLAGFENDVWAIFIAVLLVLTVVLFIGRKSDTFGRIHRSTCANLFERLWFLISDFLQNGEGLTSRRVSTRLVLGGWFLASSVLTKSYSGNLKGELLVSKRDTIDSIEDLFERKDTIPYIYFRNGIQPELERPGSAPPYYKLLKEVMDDRGVYFKSTEEMVMCTWQKKKCVLFEGIHNYHSTIQLLEPVLKKLKRWVYISKEQYFPRYLYMFFSKGLPAEIRQQIDYLVVRFVETDQYGLLVKHDNMIYKKFMLPESPVEIAEELKMIYLFPAFKILMYGFGVSALSMFIEILLFNLLPSP